MILQSLCGYYQMVAREHPGGIAQPGWCSRKVAAVIDLSQEGEVLSIIPLGDEKSKGAERKVPEQVKRSSGVAANRLCDNAAYMLGFAEASKEKRARACFEAARDLHVRILGGSAIPEARAVCSFFETWAPENACRCEAVAEVEELLLAGGNLVFRVGGMEVLDSEKVRELIDAKHSEDGQTVERICLVTGEREPIARLHPAIKGVPGAQSMGASLVGFNARAFESYGHENEQGLNAPVGETSTFQYTTALNHLLACRDHKTRIGDTTIVFWAESRDTACTSIFNLVFGQKKEEEEDVHSLNPDEDLRAILDKVRRGGHVDDPIMDSTFCILGVAPNAARLSVRFFVRDSFGKILQNIDDHYRCIDIVRAPFEREYLTPYQLMMEVKNPNSRDDKAVSALAASLMKSIFQGLPYPVALFENTLLRIAANPSEKISRGKAAICKAYLIRNRNKEVSVALDETRETQGYVLGRLFSVLEQIQNVASPGLNTTIKAKYFDSARTNPRTAFTQIIPMAEHHLDKIDGGLRVSLAKKEQELISKLDSFPKRLNMDDQAEFILGYYHQTQSRFQSKASKQIEEEQ